MPADRRTARNATSPAGPHHGFDTGLGGERDTGYGRCSRATFSCATASGDCRDGAAVIHTGYQHRMENLIWLSDVRVEHRRVDLYQLDSATGSPPLRQRPQVVSLSERERSCTPNPVSPLAAGGAAAPGGVSHAQS